jgi:hypothetical protein
MYSKSFFGQSERFPACMMLNLISIFLWRERTKTRRGKPHGKLELSEGEVNVAQRCGSVLSLSSEISARFSLFT